MGMKAGGGKGPRTVLSEINVTPLVDVMLVLLIIFMVAAGVQTVELESERQRMLEEAEEVLEEARKIEAQAEPRPEHQKVGVDLPKLNSEAVNLTEVKKLKLQVDRDLVFSIDGTVLVKCLELSPDMTRYKGVIAGADASAAEQKAFEPCLKMLGEKLVDNAKLQEDKELYVLADRALDYGKVLRVMAAVRQAGITKFGLVAEPGLLGDATVERSVPELR